jgi:hypothetical protein
MTLKSKIPLFLIFVLVIIGIAWIHRPMKLLVPTSTVKVIYAEGEDFKNNGAAYRRGFRGGIFYVHLPDVPPPFRWWVVDFNKMMIYSAPRPRSFLSLRYIFRKEPHGVQIDDRLKMAEWNWLFSEGGASFSGYSITCSVKRAQ